MIKDHRRSRDMRKTITFLNRQRVQGGWSAKCKVEHSERKAGELNRAQLRRASCAMMQALFCKNGEKWWQRARQRGLQFRSLSDAEWKTHLRMWALELGGSGRNLPQLSKWEMVRYSAKTVAWNFQWEMTFQKGEFEAFTKLVTLWTWGIAEKGTFKHILFLLVGWLMDMLDFF